MYTYSTVQNEQKRISANKLRTSVSVEKGDKFGCIYCSSVGEISQAR